MSFTFAGAFHVGRSTATAGTAIVATIPPKANSKTRVMSVVYTAAGTAHTVTLMRPFGRVAISANAAAGQAVINITADPGTGTTAGAIAANDRVAWRNTDGTVSFGVVSSVSTLAITMTANLARAAAAGGEFWFFGVHGDAGHVQLLAAASVTTTRADAAVGLAGTDGVNEPMIVHSDNVTAAGFLESVAVGYPIR